MAASRGRRSSTPDQLAALEEERRFLLDSLRDLDREHEAGDVDEHDYVTLRDGYTKRAAAVLRQIDEGKAALPAKRQRRITRAVLVAVVVLAVGGGIGFAVARSSGQRLPGQQLSGGQSDSRSALLAAARAATNNQDIVQAAELYRSVLKEDEGNVEALTYYGWLTALASNQSQDADLRTEGIREAKRSLRMAITEDPTYADPHCFLAIVAENFENDSASAKREGRRCLDLNPPADMRSQIEAFVASIGKNDAPTSSSTPTTENPESRD